jgi:hypothetical protein
MDHKSTNKAAYEHTCTFTEAEVAEILRAEACRQFKIYGSIAGSAQLKASAEYDTSAADFTLTFLSSGDS